GQTTSTTSSSTAQNTEINECITSSSTFQTSAEGVPQDVFMGSSIRYQYGAGLDISRPTCDSIRKSYHLVVSPVTVVNSYTRSESAIREAVIPGLITQLSGLDPVADSTLYRITTSEL